MEFIRNHYGLLIGSIIVLVLLGIGLIPRPVMVDVVTAERGRMVVTIEEEGRTRVADHYILSAPVDGYARRINLDVGDVVKAGDVLGSLEPLRASVLDPRSRAEAEARIAATHAALNAAERDMLAADAEAQYAAADAERLKRLFDTGAVPLDALQQSEATARRTRARLESARFAVQVAEFEKKAAEATLKYSGSQSPDSQPETVSILAPVDGSVLRIHHKSEGVVTRGAPLIEIGDPGSLEVEVEVLSRDAVQILPGTRVLLTRWGGDETLQGAVRTVEPVGFTKISALGVEEQRVLVIVDIITPKDTWQRLGDGYRVEAAFVLWEMDNVLQVPASALFRQNEEWALYVVNNNRAELTFIQAGQRNGISTEIVSGISEGEQVINHPGDNLEPDSRVRLR